MRREPRPSPAPAARCPLGRTSTRPRRPARLRPRRCAGSTITRRRPGRRRPTVTLRSTCGRRVIAAPRQLGERPPAAGQHVEQLHAGEQAVAGGGQIGGRSTCPDCSPPRARPPLPRAPRARSGRPPAVSTTLMPCSAIASRKPRLVITVTTTVSSASSAPRRGGRWRTDGDEVVAVDQCRRSRRPPGRGRRRRRRPGRRRRRRATTAALQVLGVGRAAPVVDVAAVGIGVDHVTSAPSRPQHPRRDGRCGTRWRSR